MGVPYDYYRIFYYVAKYRSFTRAAEVLMNSQPNITRSMNNLEQALGCPLFVRSNRGVTLTPEGEKLFSHVKVAQEQLLAAEKELEREKELQSGQLYIGCSETALNLFLLERLKTFHHRYPGIRLRISNHSTPQAVAAAAQGTVDLAVVTTPVNAGKEMKQTVLMEFQEQLICGAELRSLTGKMHSLRELEQYPLVMLNRDTTTYVFYNELFLRYGLILEPDTEVATTDQILPLVKHDLGLGFLPEKMVIDAVERCEVFPVALKEDIPLRSVVLVRHRQRAMSAAARAFVKMLEEENV